MNTKLNIFLLNIVMAIFAITLVSCADDANEDGDGKGQVTVQGVISARGISGSRASTYVDAANDNELIKDWFIIVVKGGYIKKIITRDSYKDYAVEREAFEFTIDAGTYDVYSFANFTKAQLETLTSSTIAENGTMPDISATKLDINSIIANGVKVGDLGSTYIPMSGKKTVTFTSSGLQSMEFEVIRMMAKLEFTFKNASTKDITLKYVKVNPVNKGDITLLPDYSTLTYDAETDPVLLSTATSENLQVDFPASTKLTANTYNTESYVLGFYLRESLASSHPTNHFMINVGIQRDGKDEEIQYALSGEDLTGINRNDYVKIPIKLTDYVVSQTVNFYPPIGGYPAVVTDNKKEEFYCQFATLGNFEINTTVYNASEGTYVYYPTWDFDGTLTIDDPNSIFATTPYVDTYTGEIFGEMNSNEGTACITANIKVEVSTGVWQIYPRRIYIIRKNA